MLKNIEQNIPVFQLKVLLSPSVWTKRKLRLSFRPLFPVCTPFFSQTLQRRGARLGWSEWACLLSPLQCPAHLPIWESQVNLLFFFLNQIVLYPHATEPTFSLLFYVEDNCLLVIFLVKPNDWGSRHESLYENVFLIYVFILLRFIFYNSFNTKLIVVAEGRGLTI